VTASDHSKDRGDFVFTTRTEMCLDFVNTVAYRGSAAPSESLHSFAELLKWCGEAGAIPARLVEELRGWRERHPKRAIDTFDESIAMREVIYGIFHAIAARANPDQVDLDLLNRGIRDAPPRSQIQRIGESFGWQIEESQTSAASLLAPVLWSAGDLLVGPQLAKLRECSNEKCLWLFLDDSKNGTRRWCSMQACGNRAKAHRHYQRQKQA
jgi:predicted RNA-binding Zn ribbon-like protein